MKTFGEIVSTEGFDPAKQDVSRIQHYSSLIPRDGVIDIGVAEQLATQFLAAVDLITEMLPRVTRHAAIVEAEVKAEKSAAMGRIDGAITLRKALIDKDELLLAKIDEYATVSALLEYLQEKLELFVKAHHFCKDLLKKYASSEEISGWSSFHDAVDPREKRHKKASDLENDSW